MASFYKFRPGAVVSTTINKYVYINVNKKFDDLIRASYSITEFAKKPQDLKHELIREALLLTGIKKGVEITSISDIPSKGTGLGSSSSYTVGLLSALHAFKRESVSREQLASEACEIEIKKCGKPIGKQDQYAAAFGGLNYIQFNCNGSVNVIPINCREAVRRKLQENLLMLYTGLTRPASSVLQKQNEVTQNSAQKRGILGQMVELARSLKVILEQGNLDEFGNLLHQNWELKKKLAQGISDERIDHWYEIARGKGAIGGKILGAGGGGFLLCYAPEKKQSRICAALPELKPMPFEFESRGSVIIYNNQE